MRSSRATTARATANSTSWSSTGPPLSSWRSRRDGPTAAGAVHEAVARDLGHDRGGRNCGAGGVAVDDRPLLVAELGHGEAVDEAQAPGPRYAGQSIAQGGQVRLVQPVAVDAAHAARDDDDL